MLKRVAVASATASLLITMAAPAFAASYSEESSGKGRSHVCRDLNRHNSGRRDGKKAEGESQDDGLTEGRTAASPSAARDCARAARAALRAAKAEQEAALAQSKTVASGLMSDISRRVAKAAYREERKAALRMGEV